MTSLIYRGVLREAIYPNTGPWIAPMGGEMDQGAMAPRMEHNTGESYDTQTTGGSNSWPYLLAMVYAWARPSAASTVIDLAGSGARSGLNRSRKSSNRKPYGIMT